MTFCQFSVVKLWDLRRTYTNSRLEPPPAWFTFEPVTGTGKQYSMSPTLSPFNDYAIDVMLNNIIITVSKYSVFILEYLMLVLSSQSTYRFYIPGVWSLPEHPFCQLHRPHVLHVQLGWSQQTTRFVYFKNGSLLCSVVILLCLFSYMLWFP